MKESEWAATKAVWFSVKNAGPSAQGHSAAWLRAWGRPILIGTALVVLPIVYFQYVGLSWSPLNPFDHLVQNGLAYLFLVLFTAVNYILFVPRWYLTKRYGRYAFIVIACLLGIVWFSHRIEQWLFLKPPNKGSAAGWVMQILWAENMFDRPTSANPVHRDVTFPPHPGELSGTGTSQATLSRSIAPEPKAPRGPGGPGPWAKMTIIFLVGGISSLLAISIQFANWRRQAEKDQLQAELGQLKAQIYPHFLFNTLNSIYALAIRKDDRTADTIVKLSEFMRYMIRDAHRDKVPLTTEINYITNYIDLQKTRLRDAVQINFRLNGDVGRYQIAPLLLFSFVENAFKYGVNPKTKSYILIELIAFNGSLQFKVVNQKVATPALNESTGAGLLNTRERLAIVYPGDHKLSIDDTPTQFTIKLTLTLPL